MDKKKNIIILFLVSLLGFGISFYLLKIYECGYSVFCHNLTTKAFALYYSMPALAIVFLVLLSAQQAIPAWTKFAKWYIPIAALFFIFYSDPGSGNYFAPYPEQVFKWLSGIYVVVSFWIIGRVVLGKKDTNS